MIFEPGIEGIIAEYINNLDDFILDLGTELFEFLVELFVISNFHTFFLSLFK